MAGLRHRGVPLQYVVGEWEFCGLTFDMRPPVFIPRPETEQLVDLALKDKTVCSSRQFLEVGCGSGAICVTLLKNLEQSRCTAVDVSEQACRLTQHNATLHRVGDRLTVYHGTFQEYVTNGRNEENFDFIVSNPPYISESELKDLQPEIIGHEDPRALCGGTDGLDVVRDILRLATRLVRSGAVWLEVDSTHPATIERLVECGKFAGIEYKMTHIDFMNRPRFCQLQVQTGFKNT